MCKIGVVPHSCVPHSYASILQILIPHWPSVARKHILHTWRAYNTVGHDDLRETRPHAKATAR